MTEMDTMRSYRYRIYPTVGQASRLVETMGLHRWLYNAALQQRQDCWRQKRVNSAGKQRGITYFDQTSEVKFIKRGMPEFAGINSASLGLTLGRLEKAYKAFFARGGFPKFKSARTFRSIAFQVGNGCRLEGLGLYLHGVCQPGDSVRVNWHRPLPDDSRPKQVTIRLEPSGHWYACIQCEVSLPEPPVHTGPEAGCDLGINQLVVITDGTVIDAAKHLEQRLRQLRIQQRRVARRAPKPGQPASKRYRLAQQQVARTHERIANARKDFAHKLSRELVLKYGRLMVEKLSIAKMVEDSELPLNRQVHDAAWGQLCMFLRYKAQETGCQVVEVDPAWTTQACSQCGTLNPRAPRLKTYTCHRCGHVEPRKANAAKSIIAAGKKTRRVLSAEEMTVKPHG